MDATLQAVTLDSNFTTISSLGAQMETVAKMMKSKDSRGADRDIFYVDQRGFDTHDNMVDDFSDLMKTLNTGVEEFKNEMVNQGLWDSVTVVMVSEFARTLPVNTGNGSDHGEYHSTCPVNFILYGFRWIIVLTHVNLLYLFTKPGEEIIL